MSKGHFIPCFISFETFEAQAESILKQAKDLIQAGAKGVAITYSANYGQTREIEKVYFRGDWETRTSGANQASVMKAMELLLGTKFQELQGKMHIAPITTMNAYDDPVDEWNDDVHMGIVITDLDRIAIYLEGGWDVLGWQNPNTTANPLHPYAVGGGVATKMPEAVSDTISENTDRVRQEIRGRYSVNQPPVNPPKPREVAINGEAFELVAFYYPDRDTAWDTIYQGQFLANFYPCEITLTINGISGSFFTAEAAFQATKWWNNPADLAQFEGAKTGTDAFHIKKGLSNQDNYYAGLGRDGAVEEVLTQKFSDPILRQALLLSGQATYWNTTKCRQDYYWSDDHDGSGANMLGRTLMEVRELYGRAAAPVGNYTVADFTAQVKLTLDGSEEPATPSS